jgi:hypothetical protein
MNHLYYSDQEPLTPYFHKTVFLLAGLKIWFLVLLSYRPLARPLPKFTYLALHYPTF